ncbi:hypothetical protein ACEPAH_3095 [Sanghuangporus vaninii]
MSAVTQAQSASPTRKLFPHLSPPRAVANIISSKRHASSNDLKARAAQRPDGNSTNVYKQRRVVSTPSNRENDKSDSDSDAEQQQQQQQDVPNGAQADGTPTPQVLHMLTFPHVAKLFVKLRRMQKKAKAHHIDSNSGNIPITHPSLLSDIGEPDITKKRARLEIQEDYVCADGIDVAKLLRASRAVLLERASPLHANVLIDELWTSSIYGPKHRSDGSFRVRIRYAATAATSSSKRDPQQPVALDKISGVPGLMTITQRDTVSLTVVELFEEAQIAQD